MRDRLAHAGVVALILTLVVFANVAIYVTVVTLAAR